MSSIDPCYMILDDVADDSLSNFVDVADVVVKWTMTMTMTVEVVVSFATGKCTVVLEGHATVVVRTVVAIVVVDFVVVVHT